MFGGNLYPVDEEGVEFEARRGELDSRVADSFGHLGLGW